MSFELGSYPEVVTPAPDVQFLAGKELNVDTKTLVQVPVPEFWVLVQQDLLLLQLILALQVAQSRSYLDFWP